MSLSFEDSLKQVSEESAMSENTPMVMSLSLDNNEVQSVNTMAVTYASTGSDWTLSDKYVYYSDYSDDSVSVIDENKNIILDPKQINLTQETNSQFIPFEMPRYFDGFDLVNTTLLIHFVNKNKAEDYANPVNVYYNDSKIKFAWLVNKNVTAVEGKVEFEIQAIGVNSKGDEYILKTKPSDSLNVLRSLSGNSNIEPDSTWITSFLTQATEKVAEAQSAAQEAKEYASDSQIYAQQANNVATSVQDVVDNAKIELEADVQAAVDEKVTTALSNYYTKTEIDEIVTNIDISDQLDEIRQELNNMDGLANFNVEYDGTTMTFYNGETVIKSISINSDPSAEWTSNYTISVEEKIATAKTEVQTELTEYKTITDVDLASIHSEIDGLPETLQSDYYTKTETDIKYATKETVDPISASVNTNKENISTLGTKITELETTVNSIDTSPRLTYDATYNTEGDYSFVLYEIENEGSTDSEVRTEKAKFVIQGGSGGSTTSSVLKIEYITTSPIIATTNDDVIIKYNFSGTDSSGDVITEGVATWKIAGTVVSTGTIIAGENSFDITKYLSIGTQKVNLSITDDAGSLVTKNWTVQKIDVRLESTFNDTLTYPIGTISFDYTPYGAVSKDVHFILDGVEIGTVTTSVSGIPMAYTLPEQTHGAHLLEVYMTAEINSSTIESNHIYKDIIWYDSSSDIPIISCVQQSFIARQYGVTNITYTVVDPNTETPTVILSEDGNIVATLELDNATNVWQYKSSEVGTHTLTITCGETVKTINAIIEKIDIELEPVTAGLVFDFNPSGKSNNDVDRLWSDGDIAMSVSDNFDWVNGGYQIDENGDQYFCIKAGTSAVINYNLFEDDAKRNGKEFKIVFKTTNVRKTDATFLTCVDGVDTSKIGVQMNVHEAYIYASASSLYLPYSEEDIIEFEFNINKDTDDIPMVMGYEDGVATRPMIYSESHNFTQSSPQYITLGSNDCDLFIYRFKVYNAALTDRGILNNFIADARNAEEMINRYNRNQIYDENNQLIPEILAEKCPQLRIVKIEAPHFTNNKSDKVTNTTIQCIYKNGDTTLDNWTAYNSQHSGQGTTSNEYGAAGRNLDLIMNKSGVDGVTPYIVLGDGTKTSKISLTRDSVEVNYLNIKVNIASSENANNALLQKRYNTYNPYVRSAKKNDSRVKDTMEFYNCVVFIKENDVDLTTHREFQDTDWHFYAIGNIGDSKKTDNTRLNDPDDPLECIVEIMDNTYPNSTFQTGVIDENGNNVYPINPSEWTVGNSAYDSLYADLFSETSADKKENGLSDTYGWRYSYDDSNPAITQPCIDAWRDFYKFVVTSTDEEFKANLGNYFVVDSALYFYLFTTRYTMIDNRAKNTFFHYGKCEDGIYRWDLCFDYDNDSALGIEY